MKEAIEKVLDYTLYANGAELILDVLVLVELILTVLIVAAVTGAMAFRGVTFLLSL